MEIKAAIHIRKKLVSFYLALVLAMLLPAVSLAQPNLKEYTIKNGKMFISIGRWIGEPSLDSFINQYDLRELALKEFIKNGFKDSLMRLGWQIEKENKDRIV